MTATSIYHLKFTDGSSTITIQPSTFNGPDGVLHDTDLLLYGRGTLNWGAGVDQNQLRLLESFACDEKTSYTTRQIPKTSEELQKGNGINKPIVGQLWFNKTDSQLYICTTKKTASEEAVWKRSNNIPVGTLSSFTKAQTGDVLFDTTNTIKKLKIRESGEWKDIGYVPLEGIGTGVRGGMSGFLTLNADPTGNLHAATKQYVDDRDLNVTDNLNIKMEDEYLPLLGGTMDGPIKVLNAPTIDTELTNKKYVDDEFNKIKRGGEFVQHNPTTAQPGDIQTVSGSNVVRVRTALNTWVQIYPAVYS